MRLPDVCARLPSWLRLFFEGDGRAAAASRHAHLRRGEWSAGPCGAARRPHTPLPATIRMGPGGCHAVTLRPAAPLRLSCEAGALWVTRDGDHADYVLAGGGQSMLVPARSVIVVVAMQSGLLRLERAATAP